jgi:hypothetical protein
MTTALTVSAQMVVSYTDAGSYTFIVPTGVNSITVQAWGGGGGSRDSSLTGRRAGAGGGAYAQTTLAVTPLDSYTVVVGAGGLSGNPGADGGDSYLSDGTLLLAKGGGGAPTDNSAGIGGQALASVGTIRYSGGNGGERGTTGGGGGGGSAFTNANGVAGSPGSGASGGAGGAGTGSGGNGGNSGQPGLNGNGPGGGGGGRGSNGDTSGDGAPGRIVISYNFAFDGEPTQVAFASAPQQTFPGSRTQLIAIELRGANGGVAVTNTTKTIQLSSSLPGVFRNANDTVDITFVTIAPGDWSANFLYRPSVAGTHVITATDSASVLDPDAQDISVVPFPIDVQTYYLPVPENQLLLVLQSIEDGGPSTPPGSPIQNRAVITAVSDDTIIYYDQMENGYEAVIRNPVGIYHSVTNPSGTQIWGDGDPSNGQPPGVTDDLIRAGTAIRLAGALTVPLSIDPNNPQFRGGDKFASTKAIAVTWAGWSTGPDTLLAGALEVFDTFSWGTEYRIPVGENVPDGTDYQIFEYTGAAIMAGPGGAVVSLNGSPIATLSEGESHLINGGLNVGDLVTSDNPVQVDMLTGDIASNYETRFFRLLPTHLWASSYYTAVSTPSANATTVWLYNPGASAISVTYRRRVSGSVTSSTVSVPAAAI